MSELPLVAPSLVACSCTAEMACASTSAGHGMTLMQQRVVASTPSKWRDAIVESIEGDGRIVVVGLDGSRSVLWHHSGLSTLVSHGEPVAVHPVYHVLAVGDARLNVAIG